MQADAQALEEHGLGLDPGQADALDLRLDGVDPPGATIPDDDGLAVGVDGSVADLDRDALEIEGGADGRSRRPDDGREAERGGHGVIL